MNINTFDCVFHPADTANSCQKLQNAAEDFFYLPGISNKLGCHQYTLINKELIWENPPVSLKTVLLNVCKVIAYATVVFPVLFGIIKTTYRYYLQTPTLDNKLGIESNHLLVDIKGDQVKKVAERLPKELYGDAVKNLIISCVDVFVYDPNNKKYLLVKRKQKPAQGAWHVPGGRQNKGESFFNAAVRKCKEELSIDIVPLKSLTNYGTIFPDSEWGAQTHTNNQVIFATIRAGSSPAVDQNHEQWHWIDITKSPANSKFFEGHDINKYVQLIYNESIGVIRDQLK